MVKFYRRVVLISDIQKDSPLSGPVGLNKGNVIQAINDCNVSNINDWNRCLKTVKDTNFGFCVPNDVIAKNVADEVAFLIVPFRFYWIIIIISYCTSKYYSV